VFLAGHTRSRILLLFSLSDYQEINFDGQPLCPPFFPRPTTQEGSSRSANVFVLLTRSVLQVAPALTSFSSEPPIKAFKKSIDDEGQLETPAAIADAKETELEQLRKSYVGEVDLPESMSFICTSGSMS